jgi:hypothetical protein
MSCELEDQDNVEKKELLQLTKDIAKQEMIVRIAKAPNTSCQPTTSSA